MIRAVLFDLDGTFADTAPDLARAVNTMRAARGLPPAPSEDTRRVTSMGARGLLGVGFGIDPAHPDYPAMRDEFLQLYENQLCCDTTLFPGMSALVDALEAQELPWGIVTNKAMRFADPLMQALGYAARAACIIGGDSTPHMKPHPAPLLAAATHIGLAPADCLYVGDDERDIRAGRAAGMITAGVRYGYLNGHDPEAWNADVLIDCPEDLIDWLRPRK